MKKKKVKVKTQLDRNKRIEKKIGRKKKQSSTGRKKQTNKVRQEKTNK